MFSLDTNINLAVERSAEQMRAVRGYTKPHGPLPSGVPGQSNGARLSRRPAFALADAMVLVGVMLLTLSACARPRLPETVAAGGESRRTAAALPAYRAQPVALGDLAPDFTLPSGAGDELRLAGEIAVGGPVVLIFYPGGDCRLCRDLLAQMALSQAEIESQGARLLAVGIQSAEDAEVMTSETGARFPLLADAEGAVSRTYGIAPLLPGQPEGGESPYMAVIVDGAGVVAWSGPALTEGGLATEIILGQLALTGAR